MVQGKHNQYKARVANLILMDSGVRELGKPQDSKPYHLGVIYA